MIDMLKRAPRKEKFISWIMSFVASSKLDSRGFSKRWNSTMLANTLSQRWTLRIRISDAKSFFYYIVMEFLWISSSNFFAWRVFFRLLFEWLEGNWNLRETIHNVREEAFLKVDQMADLYWAAFVAGDT